MRAALKALCPAVLILSPVTAALGQRGPSPEGVVRVAFAALDRQQWRTFADLVDPEALAQHRAEVLASLRGPVPEDAAPTAEELAASGVPECVAEFFAKQHAEMTRAPALSQIVARVRSLDEAQSLAPEEFLARQLEASNAGLTAFREERKIVGAVLENDSTAHVLYRRRLIPTGIVPAEAAMHLASAPGDVEVIAVRRRATDWRIVPSPSFAPGAVFVAGGVLTDP